MLDQVFADPESPAHASRNALVCGAVPRIKTTATDLTPAAPAPHLAWDRKTDSGQRASSGTSLRLQAASTGMTVKQPEGHQHRSAPRNRPSQQVTAPPGLFRDI
ncbi:hypothetical protein Scani_02040 [Streptomyces caniferus]|uniref:Uncharacterized protein n=1 Tax=Streptomyces caniferus TaxID=285557 RepID=A0A640S0M1_9ACTN|nr:hypothetical protein Scani_02040 [Streptomyces caniferus]